MASGSSVQYLHGGHSVSMYGHTHSKSMDQTGKVGSPARGQLNRKNKYFPVRVRVHVWAVSPTWLEVYVASLEPAGVRAGLKTHTHTLGRINASGIE